MSYTDIPQTAVGQLLNKQHPLAQSMKGFWVAGAGPRGLTWHSLTDRRTDGVLTNGPTWSTQTHEGGFGSLEFNGSSHYVDIGVDAYGLGIRRHATFAACVYPNTSGAYRNIMGDWQSQSGGFTIRIDDDDKLTFFVYPNNHRITTTATVTENAWNFIVGVLDGANMYLYLDGLQVGTQTLGEDIGDDAGTLKLGRRGDANHYFLGFMSESSVHSRAFSPAQIRARYNESRQGYPNLFHSGRRTRFPAAAAGPGVDGPGSYVIGGGICV